MDGSTLEGRIVRYFSCSESRIDRKHSCIGYGGGMKERRLEELVDGGDFYCK